MDNQRDRFKHEVKGYIEKQSESLANEDFMSIFKMMESLKEKEKLFEIKNKDKNDESTEIIQNEEKIKIQDLLLSQYSKREYSNSKSIEDFSICQGNDVQLNNKSNQNINNILYTFNARDQNQEEFQLEENSNYQTKRSLNESIKFLNESNKKIVNDKPLIPQERISSNTVQRNDAINIQNLINKISNLKFCLLKAFTECDDMMNNLCVSLVKQSFSQTSYIDILGEFENDLIKIKENIYINLSPINEEGHLSYQIPYNNLQTTNRNNDSKIDRENNMIQSRSLGSFSIIQTDGGKLKDKIVLYESRIHELKKSLKDKEEELKNLMGNMKYYESTIYASKNLIDELVSKNKLLKDKLVKYKVKSEYYK